MKDYRKKLIKYCENTMESNATDEQQKLDWIFGAIMFAYVAELIDTETYNELNRKYNTIE